MTEPTVYPLWVRQRAAEELNVEGDGIGIPWVPTDTTIFAFNTVCRLIQKHEVESVRDDTAEWRKAQEFALKANVGEPLANVIDTEVYAAYLAVCDAAGVEPIGINDRNDWCEGLPQ